MNSEAAKVQMPGHLWALTALCLVIGMQFYRILLPGFRFYLQDSVGMSSISLAPVALAVFALGLAAYPLHRWLGGRRALLLAASGLALLRIAVQISRAPASNLVFSALGITLFVVFLVEASVAARLRDRGTELAAGLLLGVTADTALFAAAGTLDLVWRTGFLAWVGVFVLAALTLFLASRQAPDESDGSSRAHEVASPGIWQLVAIGPWLFLQMLIFQNVARVAAISSWPLPWAGLWTWGVNVVGLALALAILRSRALGRGWVLACCVLFVLAAVPNEATGVAGVAATAIGHLLSFKLLALFLAQGRGPAGKARAGRTTVAVVLGQELLVLVTFVYYASQDIPLGFRAPAVPPVAAAIVGLGAWTAARRGEGAARRAGLAPAGLALLLGLLPLSLLPGWRSPIAGSLQGQPGLRVMTYNVHQGFNTDGWLDIERQADVIAESGADVIILQEVARGYVIDGSLDMLAWLSQRLGMHAIWAPTADPLWGNAILSRLPTDRISVAALPPAELLVRRGYVVAEFTAGGESIRLIGTHLHHRLPDSGVRVQQVEALMAAWDGGPRTAILGDMNALPGSPEMALFESAGLTDVLAEVDPRAAYTFYAADPSRQIDYIWITGDLAPGSPQVIRTTASDHLPVVVILR